MITDIGQFLSVPPFKPNEWPDTLQFEVPISSDPKNIKAILHLRSFMQAKGYVNSNSSKIQEGKTVMTFWRT